MAKPDDVIKRVEGKELGKRVKELGVAPYYLVTNRVEGGVWVTYLLLVLFELLEHGVEVGIFFGCLERESLSINKQRIHSFVCLLPHQKTKQKRVSSSSHCWGNELVISERERERGS
jgi:hypothetical protein